MTKSYPHRCIECSNDYMSSSKQSNYCSNSCQYGSERWKELGRNVQKLAPKTPRISNFKKGHIPWNKDKKVPSLIGNSNGFQKGQITWNKGKKGFLAGDKHYNWKGGITPKNRRLRASTDWKRWRQMVFERDNYTCNYCGAKNCEIHPHHKIHLANCLKYNFNGLIFDVNNGQTLCVPCHQDLHWNNGD